MKRILAVVLAATMIFSLSACAVAPQTQEAAATEAAKEEVATEAAKKEEAAPAAVDSVKIGVVLPLTGGSSRLGELQLAGIQYCAEYWNENGGLKGLGGAKIELVVADSTGSAETGAAEAERLINNENIIAMLGPYNSSVGAVMVPICEKYGVPFITTNCTADNVLEGDLKYTFRCNQSNSDNAICYASFVNELNKLGVTDPVKKVAIVYENTDWGVGCNTDYGNALAEFGYEVVMSEPFETGNADFSTIVGKIKNSDADAICPLMYVSDAALFTQQLAEYDVNLPLLSGGGGMLVDDFITTLGDYAEYICTINGWSIDTLASKPELAQEINEKCKADYGCETNENVANGWLGAATMFQAIDAAASADGDAIASALAATDFGADNIALLFHPYQGIKFEKVRTMTNQNKYASAVITQVIEGRYRLVYDGANLYQDILQYPLPTFEERGL